MPEAPEVIVRKPVLLLCAVQEHVDAAVTAIVPVVAAALTLVVVEPSVTEQELGVLGEVGVVLLLHARPETARAEATPVISNSRGSLISRSF